MSDAIVKITDRARGILAFDQELQAVRERMDAEQARHLNAIAHEELQHARTMEVLRSQQQVLEQSIFRLGAN